MSPATGTPSFLPSVPPSLPPPLSAPRAQPGPPPGSATPRGEHRGRVGVGVPGPPARSDSTKGDGCSPQFIPRSLLGLGGFQGWGGRPLTLPWGPCRERGAGGGLSLVGIYILDHAVAPKFMRSSVMVGGYFRFLPQYFPCAQPTPPGDGGGTVVQRPPPPPVPQKGARRRGAGMPGGAHL